MTKSLNAELNQIIQICFLKDCYWIFRRWLCKEQCEQCKDDLKEVEEGGQVEEGDQAECLNELQEPDDNKIDGITEEWLW